MDENECLRAENERLRKLLKAASGWVLDGSPSLFDEIQEAIQYCDHNPDKGGRLWNQSTGEIVCLGCGEKLTFRQKSVGDDSV
jgi:hypothetical protein